MGSAAQGFFSSNTTSGRPLTIEDDVRPAVVLALDLQLVDDQEPVALRLLPVDGVDVAVLDPSVWVLDPQVEPAGQQLVEALVSPQRVDAVRSGRPVHCLGQGVGRQVGVALGEELAQLVVQDDLAPIVAHDVGAVLVAMPEQHEPVDRRRLELGLAATLGHGRLPLYGLGHDLLGLAHAQFAGEELGEKEVAQSAKGLVNFAILGLLGPEWAQ